MRKVLFFLYFLIQCSLLCAQSVGIGTSTPHNNAVLDVASSTKGFLLPLLSQTQRLTISNPADGLLVYDTTNQRFYQFQNGTWRFIINSEYWSTSTTRNFVYNVSDSIGIGTTSPDKKLDVNGNIHASSNVHADEVIMATATAQAETIHATGNLSSAGAATILNDMNGNGALIIDNPSAILQFKSGGDNKTFVQLSGDNLRMGTNSGNSAGEMIIRMNGDNVVEIDGKSNLSLLKGLFASQEHGKLVIGNKITRYSSAGNSLPTLYGRVFSDGSSASMWPQTGSSERISTGIYEIDTNSSIAANAVIVVTTAGASLPRICIGRYTGSGIFRVEIFNLAGNHVNNDFYFMINDPMN